MQAILSNIPGFIIRWQLGRRPVKKWVHFGSNQCYLKKLRLLFHGKATEIDYSEELYQESKSVRSDYVKWLDAVAGDYADSREWMFSAPAVRNTYTSDLFLNVCYLEVLGQFIEDKRDIDLIFVDSPALISVFRNSFSDRVAYVPINGFFGGMCYIRSSIRLFLRFFRYLIDYSLRFFAAKIVFKGRRKHLLKEKKDLVLIRNFITEEFSDTGNDIIERHFFPGLYSYLKEQGYVPVFLPIIVKPTNYIKLFKKVLSGRRNIIFAEEFLKLRDYIFAFLVPVRALRVAINPPLYGRYNISILLKDDYHFNLTSAEYLYATLLSCLGKRLKEVHWNPKWIINWTENQAFEKGILIGLKEHFPKMKIVGGQPFIMPPNYLSPVFSKQEKLYGLLPDRVLTLGPLWKNAVSEFVEDLEIDYSPAFRYASTNSEEPISMEGNDLFVLLGIDLENTLHIMRILLKAKEYLKSFENVLIKMHPASNFDENTLSDILGQRFPESFKFVGGKLGDYFDTVSVGLCGGSGTAVELVMKGIPVVVIGETHTLTMNYLDYKEDRDIWQICFSVNQVIEALERFRLFKKESPEKLVEKARNFHQEFIAEPSEKYWENCLIKA